MVNLSDRSLSKDEEEVLRLGLNFASAPTKLPLIEMVAALEEGANKLRGEDANDLRGRLCGILRRAKLPRDNLTKDQRLALKKLREEKDVVILPADKGNSTVLMNSSGYHSKLAGMLDCDTYSVMAKDPTKTQETKICHTLKGLERSGEIVPALICVQWESN